MRTANQLRLEAYKTLYPDEYKRMCYYNTKYNMIDQQMGQLREQLLVNGKELLWDHVNRQYDAHLRGKLSYNKLLEFLSKQLKDAK